MSSSQSCSQSGWTELNKITWHGQVIAIDEKKTTLRRSYLPWPPAKPPYTWSVPGQRDNQSASGQTGRLMQEQRDHGDPQIA